uniref:AT-hook motif nuclear-localized protein n=1 Tax=Salix viminalis TaxID=40686 RepID=A0A6N2L6H0_SALVM
MPQQHACSGVSTVAYAATNNSGDGIDDKDKASLKEMLLFLKDIASKIMAFSQQGPRTICILSANGAICNVTLRQPAMSGGSVTYKIVYSGAGNQGLDMLFLIFGKYLKSFRAKRVYALNFGKCSASYFAMGHGLEICQGYSHFLVTFLGSIFAKAVMDIPYF